MSRLANSNDRAKVIRALHRAGFEEFQGAKHTVMKHLGGRYTTIPRHRRIKPKLLRAILKQCGLTEDEFLRLY